MKMTFRCCSCCLASNHLTRSGIAYRMRCEIIALLEFAGRFNSKVNQEKFPICNLLLYKLNEFMILIPQELKMNRISSNPQFQSGILNSCASLAYSSIFHTSSYFIRSSYWSYIVLCSTEIIGILRYQYSARAAQCKFCAIWDVSMIAARTIK